MATETHVQWLEKHNKRNPREVSHLPTQEKFVIFDNDKYSTDHGYPEDGISQVSFLKMTVVDSEKELRAEVTERIKQNENFSIAKLVPMRYNINIETAITLS